MVLRDYLELKVEIEGTSGEGSIAVKSFRVLVCAPPAHTLFPAHYEVVANWHVLLNLRAFKSLYQFRPFLSVPCVYFLKVGLGLNINFYV
jgi:hypothetical protein